MTPALTPEEWAKNEAKRPSGAYPADRDLAEVFVLTDGGLGIYDIAGGASTASCVSVRGRHAAAALALYEQPFGFTHDDVRLLRDYLTGEIATAGNGDPLGEDAEDRARRLGLADRIAALLPLESR